MRIVAGRHRGRRIAAPPGTEIRPTSDRARQALFDILEHGGLGTGGVSVVPGARVLDAFCGTGALAFEAISRGAESATLLDTSSKALASARATATALGETDRAAFLLRDATAPGRASGDHTLAFFDPPYGSGLAWPSLRALREQGWFAEDAVAVVEIGARQEAPVLDAGLELLRDRRYGSARLLFLRVLTSALPSGPPRPPPS